MEENKKIKYEDMGLVEFVTKILGKDLSYTEEVTLDLYEKYRFNKLNNPFQVINIDGKVSDNTSAEDIKNAINGLSERAKQMINNYFNN